MLFFWSRPFSLSSLFCVSRGKHRHLERAFLLHNSAIWMRSFVTVKIYRHRYLFNTVLIDCWLEGVRLRVYRHLFLSASSLFCIICRSPPNLLVFLYIEHTITEWGGGGGPGAPQYSFTKALHYREWSGGVLLRVGIWGHPHHLFNVLSPPHSSPLTNLGGAETCSSPGIHRSSVSGGGTCHLNTSL